MFLILCLLFLSSCSRISVQTEYFFTMDTFAESTVITKISETGKEANAKIQEICEEIESRISNTIETSEIYQLNKFYLTEVFRVDVSPAIYGLSQETAGLLETAKYMQEQTKGAYNPCLGEIIDLWDINNKEENFEHKLPEKEDFYPALERAWDINYEIKHNDSYYFIESDGIPKIDLGGIGKGYALDKISDYLVEEGIPNALISFGSSVLAAGKNKDGNLWTVGLKDPINPDGEICGYINAADKFISVSGGYERFITIVDPDTGNKYNYCHIIDPQTGYPVDNDLLCVVVVMDSQSALQTKERREKFINNGAVSDALSTALYVIGKEKALNFYNASSLDFEMILFVKDESLSKGYDIIPTNVMFTEIE
ncbi:MAG: FAD:protein FMN transferase [Oscillospiraceae bacterium]|nr:FAD:protein FMN transferase [Oscillospiraceae bacterium]